jgi:hypothetical protein
VPFGPIAFAGVARRTEKPADDDEKAVSIIDLSNLAFFSFGGCASLFAGRADA